MHMKVVSQGTGEKLRLSFLNSINEVSAKVCRFGADIAKKYFFSTLQESLGYIVYHLSNTCTVLYPVGCEAVLQSRDGGTGIFPFL